MSKQKMFSSLFSTGVALFIQIGISQNVLAGSAYLLYRFKNDLGRKIHGDPVQQQLRLIVAHGNYGQIAADVCRIRRQLVLFVQRIAVIGRLVLLICRFRRQSNLRVVNHPAAVFHAEGGVETVGSVVFTNDFFNTFYA